MRWILAGLFFMALSLALYPLSAESPRRTDSWQERATAAEQRLERVEVKVDRLLGAGEVLPMPKEIRAESGKPAASVKVKGPQVRVLATRMDAAGKRWCACEDCDCGTDCACGARVKP